MPRPAGKEDVELLLLGEAELCPELLREHPKSMTTAVTAANNAKPGHIETNAAIACQVLLVVSIMTMSHHSVGGANLKLASSSVGLARGSKIVIVRFLCPGSALASSIILRIRNESVSIHTVTFLRFTSLPVAE